MLTTAQKAPILDEDGTPLTHATATAESSNPSVASLDFQGSSVTLYCNAQTPGTTTLTVTRISDGQVATLEVEVTAEPFSISRRPLRRSAQ